jgi:hypothetical protein
VDRPIRIGPGIKPNASHVRHVRIDLPHKLAAVFALINKSP